MDAYYRRIHLSQGHWYEAAPEDAWCEEACGPLFSCCTRRARIQVHYADGCTQYMCANHATRSGYDWRKAVAKANVR